MEPEGSLRYSQEIYPIHTIPSYLSKIHFNIVHPPRHVAINTYREMIYEEVSGLFHAPTASSHGRTSPRF
jgi:hypothetical protein